MNNQAGNGRPAGWLTDVQSKHPAIADDDGTMNCASRRLEIVLWSSISGDQKGHLAFRFACLSEPKEEYYVVGVVVSTRVQ